MTIGWPTPSLEAALADLRRPQPKAPRPKRGHYKPLGDTAMAIVELVCSSPGRWYIRSLAQHLGRSEWTIAHLCRSLRERHYVLPIADGRAIERAQVVPEIRRRHAAGASWDALYYDLMRSYSDSRSAHEILKAAGVPCSGNTKSLRLRAALRSGLTPEQAQALVPCSATLLRKVQREMRRKK